MSKLFSFVFLLAVLTCAQACTGPKCMESNMTDLCRERECSILSSVDMDLPVSFGTNTQHTLLSNSFVYYANFTFRSPSAKWQTTTTLHLDIVLHDVLADPCVDDTCWMRVRPVTDYPFVSQSLWGYYDYTNGTLSLYPNFGFVYDVHTDPTEYSVAFETCVIDSDSNHCSEDMLNSKYDVIGALKRHCYSYI
jgi:hypothetical protein